MERKKAIIIGAGPAGLTAAYELCKRSNIQPIVLEQSAYMGGISRTINYRGNRIDIGGHRFFSKSDRVMRWWQEMMPIEQSDAQQIYLTYQNKTINLERAKNIRSIRDDHKTLLIRSRKSRILFNKKLFEYPISFTPDTIYKLGFARTIKIAASYAHALCFPIKNEENLEQFLINRFGWQLYTLFFKSYTQKVWGVPCQQISAQWGAQRIKGLSVSTALKHFGKKLFFQSQNVSQKNVETTLIERFLYPMFGPGQMWEETANRINAMNGSIKINMKVIRLIAEKNKITVVHARDTQTGKIEKFLADYVFSTMPIKELMQILSSDIPQKVKEVSDGLLYRDFITVGILAKQMAFNTEGMIKDNWIYVQEPDVLVGRIQIFNNWSPGMVAQPNTVWLGLEYFCFQEDELWQKSDAELIALACDELHRLGLVHYHDILDATVIKMEKTYPAYFGSYDQFHVIRSYVDQFENLFLIGRNGMHKYNNQDHSMLTAMTAVDNIISDITDKNNIWNINTEQEYHESKNA